MRMYTILHNIIRGIESTQKLSFIICGLISKLVHVSECIVCIVKKSRNAYEGLELNSNDNGIKMFNFLY